MLGALGVASQRGVGEHAAGLLAGTEGGCDPLLVDTAEVVPQDAEDAERGVGVGDAGHAVLGGCGESLLGALEAAVVCGPGLGGENLEGVYIVDKKFGIDVLCEMGGGGGGVQ